ncbi:hypothetical protein Rhe02_03190 [Rhizocola hellebori]|uniref:Secreted protein n=1 Tax=Rhizocola hellebori TaxID=1392758 RepID=A0A8J3Q2I9_9ACTN|nr:hypothetical protein [Rhizocola hellebori]GIH02252.1 hypothetical protein Rhe02_03190 [Rhizocola hellebori]
MKRRLVQALAALAIAATGSLVAATPAAADDGGPVCILNQNSWLREFPWGPVYLTLSAGRGFRVHVVRPPAPYSPGTWYYGHGAEAPNRDGWIPAENCNF